MLKNSRVVFPLTLWSILILLAAGDSIAASRQASTNSDWTRWNFLVGEWVGTGTGQPGKGTGGFSFTLDLQNRVLVRKNFSLYPASKDRPAFRHDDLMIVYQQTGKATRAIYFDNEGHVINYSVEFSSDNSSIIFVGDIVSGEPRFRLTYSKINPQDLSIKFEIAPPGKPDSFSPYINATAKRK
jgi:hypothetical protein